MGKYKALGAFFDRVFRNDLNKNFDDVDADIKVQKARVDNLITGNPQPEEVMDLRTDTEGTVHGTAWDRFASDETKKVNKFQEIDAQLAEREQDIERSLTIVKQGFKTKKPLVSFVLDDGSIHDYNKIKPIAEEKGVGFGIGVVPTWVGKTSYMSWEQLHELEDSGLFEIMSHSYTHPNLTTLTEPELESEISNSYTTLRANGFNPKGFVYPHNAHNELTAKIIGRYFNYAVSKGSGATSGKNVNFPRINNNAIFRIALGSYFDEVRSEYPADTTSLEYYKARVDEAFANSAWIVFVLHPAATDTTQLQHLRDTIDYIKSKGMEIVLPTKGFDIQGNIIQTGGLYGSFIVDSEGVNLINSENGIRVSTLNEYGFSSLVTDFNIRKITYTPINTSFASSQGFPEGKAGVLETNRLSSEIYTNFQRYYVTGNYNSPYIRYANADYTWGAWIGGTQDSVYLSPLNAYSVSTSWISFPSKKITHTPINSTYATSEGFPAAQGGMLTTYRLTSDYWLGKQEYKIGAILHSSNKETTWERFVDSNLAWTAWKRKDELSFSPSTTSFSINAQSTYDLVITGLTGMALADLVTATVHENYNLPNGIIHSVYRTTSDSLTIRLANITGSNVSVGALVWRITVKPKLR